MGSRLRPKLIAFFFFFLFLFWFDACVEAKVCGEISAAAIKSSGLKRGAVAICVACNYTSYPSLCAAHLLSYRGSKRASPTKLIVIGLKVARKWVKKGYKLSRKLVSMSKDGSSAETQAIQDCMDLMSDSNDQLSSSISRISKLKRIASHSNSNSTKIIHAHIQDALVWTSAALTYQSTCSDGLAGDNEDGILIPTGVGVQSSNPSLSISSLQKTMETVGQLVTNSLGLIAHLENHLCSWQTPDPLKFPACKKQKKKTH